MARTRTLAELRTECRQRTEQEGSTFVSDAELTRYVNQSVAKLYGKLVRARGDQYYKRRFATTASVAATATAVTTGVSGTNGDPVLTVDSGTGFPLMGPYACILTNTTDATTETVIVMTVAGVTVTLSAGVTFADAVYTLTYAEEFPAGVAVPINFFKLLGIDVTVGGRPRSIDRLDWSRRATYDTDASAWLSFDAPLAYDFEQRGDGGWLTLYPAPTTAQALTVWYIPHATVLVSDTDTFDGINGWEHYAVLDSCIAMLDKEESSSVALRAERKHVEELIDELAGTRDEGQAWRTERRWVSSGGMRPRGRGW